MVDWDHYKRAYSGEWEAGNRRERLVAELLGQVGLTAEMEGFAAGSSEFVSGRAEEHGKAKADPDLFVPETETHVEVTGTNVGWVRPDEPIRVRPDKFENALAAPDSDRWVVHVLDGPALLRCIELTEEVCTEFRDRGTSVDTRHDTDETYVEIAPDHDCVRPVTALLSRVAPDREPEYPMALRTALTRWTTVADIEDGARHSIALKLRETDVWEDHDSVDHRLRLEDRTGAEVEVTVFEDSEFASGELDEGVWYLFYDLEGDIYEGDPYLLPTADSAFERLSPDPVAGSTV